MASPFTIDVQRMGLLHSTGKIAALGADGVMRTHQSLEMQSRLFPQASERQQVLRHLVDRLSDADRRVLSGKVTPSFDAAAFAAALQAFNFEEPLGLNDVIDWVISVMETGVVHMNHPRYLGLFNPAPTLPAQCADQIAAAFNPQLASSAS